jgi:uncharacterized protein YndB with AHSA1/START domain
MAAKSTEFVLTRVFDAPRERVFKAWTEPERFAQWWGPRTFTNPVCEIDLRPGGKYRVTMRSPDGVDYPLKGVYLEIAEPERLVMTIDTDEHPPEWRDLLNKLRRESGAPEGRRGLQVHMTVLFEEQAGRTKLTIVQRFEPVTDVEANLKMGAPEGWGGSLDRLAEYVAVTTNR